MQLRKRCLVPGRYRYMSRLSPSTPFNPRLILTKKRKEMIVTFKALYPLRFRGLHRSNSEVWATELATFMFHHDDKIRLEDVMKWIKKHSWITHVAEEEEAHAPLVSASPEPPSTNCRWIRSHNPLPAIPTQLVCNRNGPSAFRPIGFRPIDPALATGQRNRKAIKKNVQSGPEPSTSQCAKRKYPTEQIVPGSSKDVASAKTKKSSVLNSFRRGRVENQNIQHDDPNMLVLNPVSPIPSDIGDNESGVTENEDRQQSRSADMDRVVSPDISVTTSTSSSGSTSRHVILDQQTEANSRSNNRLRKISAEYGRAFNDIRELIEFCQGQPSLRFRLEPLKKVAQALSRSNLEFITRNIPCGHSAEAIAGANTRIKDEVEDDSEDDDENDEIDIGNQQSPILFISDSMLPII